MTLSEAIDFCEKISKTKSCKEYNTKFSEIIKYLHMLQNVEKYCSQFSD
jgi:hypothetical protein